MICMDMWDDETNMQAKIDKLEYEVARLKREVLPKKTITRNNPPPPPTRTPPCKLAHHPVIKRF